MCPWLFDRGCVLPASVFCRRKDSTRGSNTALRIPRNRTAHRAAKSRFRHIALCAPPMWGAFLCASWLFDRGCVLPTSVSRRRKDSTRGSNTVLRIPPGSHGAPRREEQIPPYRALRTPDVGVPFYVPRGFSTAGAFFLPLFSADARIAPTVRTLLFGSPGIARRIAPRRADSAISRSAALAILKNK